MRGLGIAIHFDLFDLDVGGRLESVNLKNTSLERGFFPGAFSSTIKREIFTNNTFFAGFDFGVVGVAGTLEWQLSVDFFKHFITPWPFFLHGIIFHYFFSVFGCSGDPFRP